MEIFDNVTRIVRDDLTETIKPHSRISIAAACFSIYAYQELKKQLSSVDQCRFIFTSPTFVTEKTAKEKREFYIPRLNRERSLYGTEFEVKLRNELTQKAIARECAEWIRKKATFKSNSTQEGMQGFMNVDSDGQPVTYMPINGFTTVDIGCDRGRNVYNMVNKFDAPFSSEYMKLFERIWSDESRMQDVTEDVIDTISAVYQENPPELVYFLTLYHIFSEFLEDISEDVLPNEATGFKSSVVWNKLYDFQRDAALGIINKLEQYNGCILADSVGLGKTFSALAVIKYFQTQGYTTLVLCPKKLEQNWTQYLRRNDSLFERDNFDYIVRFHTDLQDERLQNYPTAKLDYLQHQENLLIVIDESHNLRNENSGRYRELVDSIIRKQGEDDTRDVKILMLSATPINTGLRDVKGQFNLIARGDDTHFDSEDFDIESLRYLFADCQKKYSAWCKNEDRTIGEFIKELPPKFFNLTDRLIVARTRKMIETTLGEDLHFPKKEKPKNVYQGVDHFGTFKSTKEIYDAFDALSLTAYQPSQYIPEKVSIANKEKKGNWQDDVFREEFLVKMMGILFMKRLESSWHSCMLTVEKVLNVHENILAKVVDLKSKRISGEVNTVIGDSFDDEELEELFTMHRKKDTVRLSDMKNLDGFENGLRKDIEKLRVIYSNLQAYQRDYERKIEKDLKLDELVKILEEKKQATNKKVVIFTVYADTAKFIYDELYKRGFRKMAMVSGQGCYTTGSHDTTRFNEILQSFAPYSKLYKEKDWSALYKKANLPKVEYYNEDKDRWEVPYDVWQDLMRKYNEKDLRLIDDEINILIATDCLSEGQNLQDADLQINYDIHWNPVRLIQRFGRIDRIGSPCETIRCVNFWPARSFEEYLDLENRIMNRMAIMTLAGSETQDINDKYAHMVADNSLQDKNASRLLKELSENSLSDIESDRTLSLKDFSLEVYRQDFLEYLEAHKDFFRQMPSGVYSGFEVSPDLFTDVPESIVAVMGYPHREEGSKKAYKNIYLVCQPVDAKAKATYQELNQAEILEFLRQNKKKDRFVPEWIEAADSEKITKLSGILQSWMKSQWKDEGTNLLNDLFSSRKTIKEKPSLTANLDQKFKMENFDLIVWEYISKGN